MRILLDAAARSEMWTAADFYDECREGLGVEFLDAVDEALAKIKLRPFIGSPMTQQFRRVYLRRFPYALVYSVEENVAFVAAVMHMKRHPQYWKGRGIQS